MKIKVRNCAGRFLVILIVNVLLEQTVSQQREISLLANNAGIESRIELIAKDKYCENTVYQGIVSDEGLSTGGVNGTDESRSVILCALQAETNLQCSDITITYVHSYAECWCVRAREECKLE